MKFLDLGQAGFLKDVSGRYNLKKQSPEKQEELTRMYGLLKSADFKLRNDVLPIVRE